MSKERELLKKILATGWLNNELSCEVEELLTIAGVIDFEGSYFHGESV